jgi:hypothetical protein
MCGMNRSMGVALATDRRGDVSSMAGWNEDAGLTKRVEEKDSSVFSKNIQHACKLVRCRSCMHGPSEGGGISTRSACVYGNMHLNVPFRTLLHVCEAHTYVQLYCDSPNRGPNPPKHGHFLLLKKGSGNSGCVLHNYAAHTQKQWQCHSGGWLR